MAVWSESGPPPAFYRQALEPLAPSTSTFAPLTGIYFMRPSAFVPHAHLRSPSLFSPQLDQHDLVPHIPALAAFISYYPVRLTKWVISCYRRAPPPSWMRSVPWSLSIYCYSRSLVPQWSPKPDGDVTSFSHPSVQYAQFPISYYTLLRIF